MVAENLQMAALITAAVGIILGLLKKAKWYVAAWTPKVAPILGAVLAVVVNEMEWVIPLMSMPEALGWGAAAGLAAVGAHNLGKRLAPERVR